MTGAVVSLVPTIRSADIDATPDVIGDRFGFHLHGEVRDLAGVLNPAATYQVRLAEATAGDITQGDWGYYAKQVIGLGDEFLKVWVRWNEEQAVYDYYLRAGAGQVFTHATPYLGPVW